MGKAPFRGKSGRMTSGLVDLIGQKARYSMDPLRTSRLGSWLIAMKLENTCLFDEAAKVFVKLLTSCLERMADIT